MEYNPTNISESQPERPNFTNEVKQFYNGDFKKLFVVFFTDPFDGVRAIFNTPSDKSFVQALILFGSVFVIYFLGGYLIAGQMREYMNFTAFLQIALIPALVMVSISGFSFAIKSVFGKANFKSELLTGGLCGIPLALTILLILIGKIFGNGTDLISIYQNPMAAGSIMMLIMVYLLLMIINVFYQSLTAGGTKYLLAWYLSPLGVMLSFYVAFNVANNLLN
ncbi:MAG: hypothetical protein WCR52_16515 [Bacteroidota bacterium]